MNGKKHTVIFETYDRNPSADEGYDHVIQFRYIDLSVPEDKDWYCNPPDNTNILFTFAGHVKERAGRG